MTPQLVEIRLFGPMDVRVAGKPIPAARTQKCLWLLALLALRPGASLDRDQLAATLWPDSDNARYNLRRALSDLRVALGDGAAALQARPQSLRLDPATSWVDAVAFDEALRGRRPAEAVELYRGPLLPGCYDDWALAERDIREERYLQALECLAREDAPRPWLPLLRKALRENPGRESGARALMHALASGGDPAELRSFYREHCARRLPDAPDLETTALYRSLTRPTPPAPDESPAVRWSERTSFLGRETEMEAVSELLERARLVTLTGPGGCGKTRLALRVGARRGGRVALAELAALGDRSLLVTAVAAACGIALRAQDDPFEALASALAQERSLLILDNCEHLIGDCARLADRLLGACPELTVLATSREPLRVVGENLYPVPPLALPPRTPAPTPAILEKFAATRLLLERVQEVRAGFTATDASAPVMAALCRRLDGLPLAIELAAARLQVMSVEDLLARVETRLGILSDGARTAAPRQQTLTALIDWSYSLLTAPERLLLRRLSVFSGGWSLGAAESVCGAEPLEAHTLADLHASLTGKSLALFDGGRYRLLETIREYGRERLEPGESQDLHRRHWEWCFRQAKNAQDRAYTPEDVALLRGLDAEEENLRAACQWGSEQDGDQELQMVTCLCHYWLSRGRFGEAQARYEAALGRPRSAARTRARLSALNHLGLLYLESGQLPRAVARFEEALEIALEVGETRSRAMVLGNLGKALTELKPRRPEYLARARAALEECITLFETLEIPRSVALNLNLLGVVFKEMGRFADAKVCYARALRTGDFGIGMQSDIRGNLGNVLEREGDLEAAERCWRDGLTLQREGGFVIGTVHSLRSLGKLLVRRGQWDEARACLREALHLVREHRMDPRPALHGVALLRFGEGRYAEAATLLAAALPDAAPIPAPGSADIPEPLEGLRARLTEAELARAWVEGMVLTDDEALARALEDEKTK